MKKILLFVITSMAAQISFGQFSGPFTTTANNTIQSGFLGLGTKPTSTSTVLPNFNLQLHGTVDYSEDYTPASDAPSGMSQDNSNPKPTSGSEKTLTNFGKTTRIGLTNTTTGMLNTDGVVLRMSENNFTLANREAGDISFTVPNVSFLISNSSKRIFAGGLSSPTSTTYAKFNVASGSTDNGLYIQNSGNGTYGLSVRTITNSNDAIQVNGTVSILGVSSPIKNFSVKGTGEVISGNQTINSPSNTNALTVQTGTTINFLVKSAGQVFARQYTTTVGLIADYVFEKDYKLLPLNELKTYISNNKHLPNIPSAKEYEERGELDLGELNRKLLEKVEELTLYILQLEERTKALENK